MRIAIPLLPILVEVRWRPLRPFRVSIRALMLTVLLAGLVFSLVNELRRLGRAASDHTAQMLKANADRPKSPPYGPTPLERWHAMKAMESRAAHERLDLLLFILLLASASLGVVAALGRALDGLSRRWVVPSGDEPSGRPATATVGEVD